MAEREIPIAIRITADISQALSQLDTLRSRIVTLTGDVKELGKGLEVKVGKPTTRVTTGFKDLDKSLRGLRASYRQMTLSTEVLNAVLAEQLPITKATTTVIGRLSSRVGLSAREYISMMKRAREANRTLEDIRLQARLVNVQFGMLGRTLRIFSQQLFWTSLGLMFGFMAFLRVRRATYAYHRSIRGLAEAMWDLQRLQEELTKTIITYGYGSEEYIRIAERVRRAEFMVTEARERVRMSSEALILSYFMLAFGILPTLLRLSTEMILIQNLQAVAQAILTARTQLGTKATMEEIFAKSLSILASKKLIAITWKTIGVKMALYGALTFGIGAIVAYVGAMWMMTIAEQQAIAMTERWSEELYGGSLFENLKEITKATEESTRAINNYSQTIRRARRETEQFNVGAFTPHQGISHSSPVLLNVNINITGVRDVREIEESVFQGLTRAISLIGGRMR